MPDIGLISQSAIGARMLFMPSLRQIATTKTSLSEADIAWLEELVKEWHLIADLSFSDLICWLPDVDDNIFWAAAQVRPATGPTALLDDVVGEDVSYDCEHDVTNAYLARQNWQTSENQLGAGIPVETLAIPIIRGDRCIAVIERHTNRMGIRALGNLEETYRETAEVLIVMMANQIFPNLDRLLPSGGPTVGDGMIRLDANGIVTFASPNAVSAYRVLGSTGDLHGESLRQVSQGLSPRLEPVGHSVMSDLSRQMPADIDVEANEASIRLRILPLFDETGFVGHLVMVKDVTTLIKRERQLVSKDATIREIHHRVKNNLQTVAALLRMQARRIESDDAKAALKSAMSRVAAIAAVHEILSQAFDEEVLFDDVTDRILRMVGDVAATRGKVRARRYGTFGMIPAAVATSLSLVITELCQNAIEHGLKSGTGNVEVHPSRDGDRLTVRVADDGIGLPDGFDIANATSLGLSIVKTLVSELGGDLEVGPNPAGSGAQAVVELQVSGN